jgi:hypothetical protein
MIEKKYIIKSLLNPKSLNCKTLCTTLIEMGVREDFIIERKKERTSWIFFVSISNRRKGFEASDPILRNKVGQTASKHSTTKNT